MANIQEIGAQIGKQLAPFFNELTTGDLQVCVSAEVAKHHLTPTEAREAEEIALEYINNEKSQA
jgi:hypothetical protein